MSWEPITKIQNSRLKELYYHDKFLVGRDKLWNVYNSKYTDHPVSQRTVLNDFLKKQEIHQTYNRPTIKRGIIRPILNSTRGYMSLDCVVMKPYNGYTTIYDMVDTFSKRFYAMAFKAQTAKNTIKFIKAFREATPYIKISVIQCDNGSEFQELFKSWCSSEGITLNYSKPHSPWSNIVEKYGGDMKRMLFQALAVEKSNDWVNMLPIIVSNMNMTKNFTTKTTHLELDKSIDKEVHTKAFTLIQNRANKKYRVKAQLGKDIQVWDWVRRLHDYDAARIQKASKRGYYALPVYEVLRVVQSRFPNALPSYKLENIDTKETLPG